MSDEETYTPSARDAVIAYFGRNAQGNLRQFCVRCNDVAPLTGDECRAGPHKIHGDLITDGDLTQRVEDGEACDCYGVTFLQLSTMCQQEHDEQQARWSRKSKADSNVLIEYGVRALIRCRVY